MLKGTTGSLTYTGKIPKGLFVTKAKFCVF